MSLPLETVRVLDLTRLLPGPFCTRQMADFGAEVIKVEDPADGGDPFRRREPRVGGHSVVFAALNRNKKSVTLNLKAEKGKEIFRKMIQRADVLVESFRPGVMERLGFGYSALKDLNPRLIYCAITGYGQDGPYAHLPGHDINYIGLAGLLQLQGERGRPPVPPAGQIADIGGGAMMGLTGILLALLARNLTGKGQFVDVSMMDGVVAWMHSVVPEYLASSRLPQRGAMGLTGGRACYGVYKTSDERFLAVGALEPKFWKTFCEVINKEEFIPKLGDALAVQDRMKEEIQAVILTRTRDQWLEAFAGKDTSVTAVNDLEELLHDPQVMHRQMLPEVEHLGMGRLRQVGIPIKLSHTPGQIRTTAPELGEHNAQLLAECGISEEELARLQEQGVI